jgi:hypothetical protein
MHVDGDDLTGMLVARTSGSGKKRDLLCATMMEWVMRELGEMMMGRDWERLQEIMWVEIEKDASLSSFCTTKDVFVGGDGGG